MRVPSRAWTRTWTVSVAVRCEVIITPAAEPGAPPGVCGAQDVAVASSTDCERARQEVLRELRYQGWHVESRHAPVTCPGHSGPLPRCARCDTPTPGQYLRDVWWRRYDPELSELPTGAALCPDCIKCSHARVAADRRDVLQATR